jgi:DNA-binding LacI/PurR family transcriptional regulator
VAGLRVPEDVMIIGFDGLDETKYSLPTLSTIDPGRDEIADNAVRVLVQRIEEGQTPPAPEVYLADYTVIDRESTAH